MLDGPCHKKQLQEFVTVSNSLADSEQRFGEFFIKCGKGLTKFFKPLAKVRKKFKNSLHRFDKGLAKSWLSLGSVLARLETIFAKTWHRFGI